MTARLALFGASLLLALAAVEGVLRVAFAPSFVLDRRSDAFFEARFDEARELARATGTNFVSIESDPELGWRNRPGLRLAERSTNSAGLRGEREYAVERAPGVRRVVLLGDSMTFGFGVRDAETFAARLERALPASEVLNLGVNGYGTDQQLLLWLREGRRYAPDLVLLVFFVDDFHRNANRFRDLPKPWFELEDGGLALRGVPVPSEAALLALAPRSRAAELRVLAALRLALARALGEPETHFRHKLSLCEAILRELARSAAEGGARAALATIPTLLDTRAEDAHILAAVEAAAERAGLDVVRLGPALLDASRDAAEPVRLEDDGHLSPRGHAVVAEQLADALRAWLPPAAEPAAGAAGRAP